MASILKIKNIIINKVLHHIITTHTKKETHSTIIIALYFFVYNMASIKNINFCNQYYFYGFFFIKHTSHLISHTHIHRLLQP